MDSSQNMLKKSDACFLPHIVSIPVSLQIREHVHHTVDHTQEVKPFKVLLIKIMAQLKMVYQTLK